MGAAGAPSREGGLLAKGGRGREMLLIGERCPDFAYFLPAGQIGRSLIKGNC